MLLAGKKKEAPFRSLLPFVPIYPGSAGGYLTRTAFFRDLPPRWSASCFGERAWNTEFFRIRLRKTATHLRFVRAESIFAIVPLTLL